MSKSQSILSLAGVTAAACFVLTFASAANAQIITNGSFEAPVTGGFNNSLTSIPGWTATVGTIEIGNGTLYGVTGFSGTQVLELDAMVNSTVEQSIAGLTADTYTVTFDAARRDPATSTPDNSSFTYDVLWNGTVVGSYSPTSTAMSTQTLDLTAVANQDNVLAFRGTGASDTWGAIIDNVAMVKKPSTGVPEPGTLALAMGLLPIAGVVLRRRAAK